MKIKSGVAIAATAALVASVVLGLPTAAMADTVLGVRDCPGELGSYSLTTSSTSNSGAVWHGHAQLPAGSGYQEANWVNTGLQTRNFSAGYNNVSFGIETNGNMSYATYCFL